MKIKLNTRIKSDQGLLVIPLFKEDLGKISSIWPESIKSFIEDRINFDKFKAKKNELFLTYLNDKNLPKILLVIGSSSYGNFDGRAARELGGVLGKIIKKEKLTEMSLVLGAEIVNRSPEIVEGLLSVQYKTDRYKTGNSQKSSDYKLELLHIISEKLPKNLEENLDRTKILCAGMDLTKDLVNSPSNIVDGDYLAKEARRIAHENKYKIIILGNKELKAMSWGALLAVNQGSEKEAKCIVLEYDGAKDKKVKPIVIVGKGVIFDTGGYNLKPTNYIETMHQDMAGGATVLGLFSILKKLNIKQNVIGVIPIVENLVNEKAYRPSDIIKTFSGKTVEVTNTDAEGRLILADAITYSTKLNPEAIITIATLTGAVAIALGDRYAGVMGNNLKLRRDLCKAGREVDDLAWPLPIHRDYKKKMESPIADFRNDDTGSKRLAGSSKGAAFLEKFVEKLPFCHIDIGGTAFTDDPKEYQTKGATAHGFRLLLRYLQNRH